jgi:hypothetical protein
MTLFLFLAALAPAAQAANVIVDFSEPSGYSAKLYPAQEKQVLTQVFPKYVKSFDQCPQDDTSVELIESDVNVVRGKFSSSTVEDMVITFESSECPGSHAGRHSNVLLVRNFQVLDARNDLLSASVYKVMDTDNDGLNEAITASTGGNQGYTGTAATTLSFKNGQITETTFVAGNVHYDDCGLDENTKGEYDAVFFADPANPGRTIQKNYHKACGAPKSSYKLYSQGPLDQSP